MDNQNLFVPALAISRQPTQWLWQDRIPRGALTVFEGDPGAAKSTLLADIAARVTTGRPMPETDSECPPSSVLWLGAEDDSAATVENLRIAGANLDRVRLYDKTAGELMLPESAIMIERAAAQAGLIVIDPLASFMSGSPNSESAVRRALQPLAVIAERTGTAVCIVRHLAKSRSKRALYAGAGSIGIVALARSAILVGLEPGEGGRRAAAQFKNNAGPRSPSLAFKIVDEADGRRIDWLGISEFTAEQLVNDSGTDLSAIEEAAMLLVSVLRNGSQWANDVFAVAMRSGVSKSTLGRAKRLLKIESHRAGFGLASRIYWTLPRHSVLIETLKERELDALAAQLFSGDDGPPMDAPAESPTDREPPAPGDDGDADWWKQPA